MRVTVWDTSAVSKLSKLQDCESLVARMHAGHAHWIPRCVFDEIASTKSQEERSRILTACRELTRSSGRFMLHPWDLIVAGVRMYWEVGFIDWETLLEPRCEIEQAVASGVFNDDLARAQHPDLKNKLIAVEDWFASQKPLFKTLFRPGRNWAEAADERAAFARSKGVFLNNVLYYCRNILGREVDLCYAARFSDAFPPIEAVICSYFLGHVLRSEDSPRKNQAGAVDLLAAAYLPLCEIFVSDDHNQQQVFRDVARCCSPRTQVLWFNGDFRKRFVSSS